MTFLTVKQQYIKKNHKYWPDLFEIWSSSRLLRVVEINWASTSASVTRGGIVGSGSLNLIQI